MSDCDPVLSCPALARCAAGPFRAVSVQPSVRHGAVISWVLGPNDWPAPLRYRVEVNRTGATDEVDWKPATPLEEDIASAVDTAPRTSGWYQLTKYRVGVRDADNVWHHSEAVPANQGPISIHQRSLLNEIIRREEKRYLLKASPATPGYLLKVRYYGTKCGRCVDQDSGESTMSHCTLCLGTGYITGYHQPVPCFNVDLSPASEDLKMYQGQPTGVQGAIHRIRYLNRPEVNPWDVWVDATTDDRYMVGGIQPITTMNSLKIVCHAAAARLAYDHPAYMVKVANG